MRFTVDGSWRRYGPVVIAGSPLRVFRLTPKGETVVADIETGVDVMPSRMVDRLLDGGAIHPRTGPRTGPRTSSVAETTTGGELFTAADVTVVTPQLGGVAARAGRLVVDDGSQPPLAGAALRLATNAGPASARNAARPHVDTPLVAFVDADVDIREGWLDALLPHFGDPQVGLVAPRVTGERGSPLDLGREPARIRAGTRVSYVPGAAIVVRVAAFDAVGGFDEQLRFGEDVDFVWRLDEAGWRCRFEPSSQLRHRPRPTLRLRLRQHAGYGTSAAPLALRHPGALSPLSTNGWTAATWALSAAGHTVAASGLAIGSALALVPRLPGVAPKVSFELAMRGHLGAARQLASAIRRVWWPFVAAGSLFSKRIRWIGVAAMLADVRAAPTDVAYGWGVWRGMRRHRTLAPIVPRLSAWPGSGR